MKTLVIFIASLVAFTAQAEGTRYVSDEFEITLRTGKGNGHKILKNLASGTKLELVELDEEEKYALVRTDSGVEGWVVARYLVDRPIAKQRIDFFERKNKDLNEKIKELRDELKDIKAEASSLSKENNNLLSSRNKLEKEVATIKEVSSNELALYDENKTLKEQLLTIKRSVQELQQENINLQDQSARDWFLIGAGVCILGIIFGLILPNIRFRKKHSWGGL